MTMRWTAYCGVMTMRVDRVLRRDDYAVYRVLRRDDYAVYRVLRRDDYAVDHTDIAA